MALLELAHVDGDDEALAAKEKLGQAERRLRLADAAGADEQEHAEGLLRGLEAGAGGAQLARDGGQAAVLTANAPAKPVLELEDGVDVVLDHLADGDAGPVADDGGDERLVHVRVDEQLLGLDGLELVELGPQPRGAWPRWSPSPSGGRRCALDDGALLGGPFLEDLEVGLELGLLGEGAGLRLVGHRDAGGEVALVGLELALEPRPEPPSCRR